MAPLMAGVFAERGRDAAVFRGDDGLDEVTVTTTTSVWWVRAGEVREHTIDPAELGIDRHPLSALRGGDAAHNAEVVRSLLAGERGAVRDAVLLNAGVGLALTRPDRGTGHGEFVPHLREAMDRAEQAIDSGAAADVLHRWVEATTRLG
ncbi:MAG TPA: anthranilate phosphoribosyltransferase, partial [Segeticoccus sp.]|nr:anthranilate phosphoribosyltransferase [Segeticoccus sp.]